MKVFFLIYSTTVLTGTYVKYMWAAAIVSHTIIENKHLKTCAVLLINRSRQAHISYGMQYIIHLQCISHSHKFKAQTRQSLATKCCAVLSKQWLPIST